MDPSRLLIDAHTSDEWRRKGFSSVLQEESQDYEDAIMYMLLEHKRVSPDVVGEYYPEAGDLTCAEDGAELKKISKKASEPWDALWLSTTETGGIQHRNRLADAGGLRTK